MTLALGRLGASFGKLGAGVGGPSTPGFSLTAQTVAEDAALNTVIGAFTPFNLGALTVSSYAITADPDSKFNISGSNLRVNGALDYETATSHSVTVRMTLSDASTVDRTFTITITDVSDSNAGSPIGLLLALTKAA